MLAKSKTSLCKRSYARLAEAIIASGVQANDKLFLDSDWFELLRDIVSLDIEMQNRVNIPRQQSRKGSASYKED